MIEIQCKSKKEKSFLEIMWIETMQTILANFVKHLIIKYKDSITSFLVTEWILDKNTRVQREVIRCNEIYYSAAHLKDWTRIFRTGRQKNI